MHLIGTCTSDIPRRLYRDDKACIEFIYYISQVIQVEVLDRVRTSPLFMSGDWNLTNLASLATAKDLNCKAISDSGLWLSKSAAVSTLCDNLESVLVYFKDIVVKDDTSAKGLFQKLTSFRIIYILYFLADILCGLTKLSKVFQKVVVDVSSVGSLVNMTCTEIQVNYLMECTDLNAYDHDASGFPILPDFGPPGGYLKRLQSELRGGNWFHFVLISRDLENRDLESAITFQKSFANALISALQDRFQDNNIVFAFKIFNPREGPVDDIFVKALELWKGATNHRFLYSNPTAHLSGFQVSDFAGRTIPDPEAQAEVVETQQHVDT
ncbi:hypothetical protein R1sor_015769 [Riccia sorocarpa]|uniref:Uncharacterized protein n=1 Tax=Riccia sorocarpa TaxID=122646 RepID=A0ABD3HD55_9MARC